MIQTFVLNKGTSAFEGLEDFPGAVDEVEAIYKDTISSAEASYRRPKGRRHFRSVCG
jgi:hypothetical protein